MRWLMKRRMMDEVPCRGGAHRRTSDFHSSHCLRNVSGVGWTVKYGG